MTFGTAEEDSLRRDLTINALFYNINTGEVEDFTNRGIQDLKSGIIRTPLDPEQTFKDDPLRVLRVFRFAARYNFECENEMVEAIK
jgi:tRNA nucleotidyltransferase (CCA-adding enzyme)